MSLVAIASELETCKNRMSSLKNTKIAWFVGNLKLKWSRRRGSNPHGTKYHWILSPARLPVPPLREYGVSY